jgi:hypothetical protein
MSADEVRQLLGEPNSVTVRPDLTVWVCGDIAEVRFDKGTMRVEGWEEPSEVVPSNLAWRQLGVGMSADEVRRLLGEPKRVSVMKGLAFWKYGDFGEVHFDSASMRVNGWEK